MLGGDREDLLDASEEESSNLLMSQAIEVEQHDLASL